MSETSTSAPPTVETSLTKSPTPPQRSPIRKTSSDIVFIPGSKAPEMIYIPGLGMRPTEKFFPKEVPLSPKAAQKLHVLIGLEHAFQTEEQIHDKSISQLTDILTEQEAQSFTTALQGKDIIADYGVDFGITDEGMDALSKLPPQKRDGVFATIYARYYLKKKKQESEAKTPSSPLPEVTQESI